ncbi:polyketide synthase dehydratase domain-containing protein, partial [Micromonospora parva]|uniref:phosphopantetheine-binding protein n=1 Tax=Micromonospora parva TaxID=1464048 RepID=UPI003406C6BA
DGVLTAAAQHCLPEGAQATFIAPLRANQPETATITTALAQLSALGVSLDWQSVADLPVDWTAFFAEVGARRVPLPTYAFQNRPYFLTAEPADTTQDVTAVGLRAAAHPLLGAAVDLPGAGAVLLTGRLSARTHTWLAQYAVHGRAVVPHAALVELVLRASAGTRCDRLDDLTIEAPLPMPVAGARQISVSVGEPRSDGSRTVDVYSRADDDSRQDWTRHVTATARTGARPGPAPATEPWPPQHAVALDTAGHYELLARHGVEYGPFLRAVRAAWRDGQDLLAELAVPDLDGPDAGRFVLHPALLESALAVIPTDDTPQALRVLSGLTVREVGAGTVRVRLHPTGATTFSVTFIDEQGNLVVHADTVELGGIAADDLKAAEPATPAMYTPAPAAGGIGIDQAGTVVRWGELDEAERVVAVTDVVRRCAASVFGHDTADEIDLGRRFEDLGIDSLTAVELRNRLVAATGLALPPTLLFDCPTPADVVDRLSDEIHRAQPDATASVHEHLDRLEPMLAALTADQSGGAVVGDRLRSLAASLTVRSAGGAPGARQRDGVHIESASAEELFELLDAELDD